MNLLSARDASLLNKKPASGKGAGRFFLTMATPLPYHLEKDLGRKLCAPSFRTVCPLAKNHNKT